MKMGDLIFKNPWHSARVNGVMFNLEHGFAGFRMRFAGLFQLPKFCHFKATIWPFLTSEHVDHSQRPASTSYFG